MPRNYTNRTSQITEWTNALLEDLLSALKAKRSNEIVRAFAQELIDDKDLPISYLVQKVKNTLGTAEAERLDMLVRGRYAVEKSEAERANSAGGVRGFVRRFLR